MEAIPLVEMSAVACAKALAFSWISRFGVPKTITTDRGPQFTSNLWSQLCSMLNIAHRQMTAYHPESNGAVERLHRRLNDALCAHSAAATWAEELPFVLLGLRTKPREELVIPQLNLLMEPQLFYPMSFCSVMSLMLILLLKI
jgi:transposase InsO family protein